MAIFRNVNMSFWTDPKVVDDYTPEDKYFMLYAMTNQYTNIVGCYEISIKQMSNDLGYTKDVVERIINRFKEIHNTIDYNFTTKELFIKNWSKYNWSASPKLDNHLYSFIEKVKSDLFHDELAKIFNERETIKENNTLLIPYRYPMDTTITNTIPISISSSIPIPISSSNSISNINANNNSINNKIDEETINEDVYKNIINRLNELAGTNFRSTGKATKDLIKNLLKDYKEEDILMVVEKMCYKWANPKNGEKDMSEYLRPSTLFRRSNFENYLGMKVQQREMTTKDLADNGVLDFSKFRN